MLLRLSLFSLSAAVLVGTATAHAADLAALSTAVVRSDAAPAPPPTPPAETCPYATIHVDWPRADAGVSSLDADAFAAIAAAYLGSLPKAGFTVVSERSEAYWHALLRFRRSRQNHAVFLAATTIFARGDPDREAFADKEGVFEGPPLLNAVQFRTPDQQAEQLEFGGIFDVVEFSKDRVGDWADRAATHARTSLERRIERLCSRRGEELEAEERRLEQIRQTLADEIRRVRRLRAKQGKEIELRTDETERVAPAPTP